MKLISLLFFLSLLFGTITGWSVVPGVTIYVHDVVLLIFLAFSFWVVSRKKKFQQPKLLGAIIGFIGAAGLSLLINSLRFPAHELIQSSLYLIRWAIYAGLYIILVQQLFSPVLILDELFITGTGFGILGVFQYVFFPSLRPLEFLGWDPHYFRLFSTLLDPNFAGIILVLSIFVGIYEFRFRRQSKLILGCIAVLLVSLYLTYSRSSYLAFFVGLITLAVRSVKWKTHGIAAIIAFLLLVVVLPKPGGDTLRLDRMASAVSRLQNWQESARKIGESPIFGFGFDTLRFMPLQGGQIDTLSKAAAGVDNSLLFVLLTTGVVGLITYGYFAVRVIGVIGEIGKKQNVLKNIYLASFLAVLVHSMFVNSLFYPWVMIWMWTLTGVVENKLRRSLANHSG